MPDIERKTVSASQAAGLFGISPYCTRRSLYDFLHDGLDIDEKENDSMEFGKFAQPFILKRAAEKLNLEIIPNDKDVYVRHPTDPIGATIDAHLICPTRGYGVVEAKSLRYMIYRDGWSATNAPIHIETQIMTQMAIPHPVYGLPKWGAIAAMIGANEDFVLYARKPNPEMIERITEESKRLMLDVANHNRPPVFGEDIELRGINQLWPETPKNKRLEDMADMVLGQMLNDYAHAHEQEAFWDKLKTQLKTKCLDRTQDHGDIRVYGAAAAVNKAHVGASIMQLPGEIRSGLMIALAALDDSGNADLDAAALAAAKQRAIAAISAAINWEKVTRSASTRTTLEVTPMPLDVAPEDTGSYAFEA